MQPDLQVVTGRQHRDTPTAFDPPPAAGLFAMLHLSVPAIPHLFLMAVVLSLLTRASGSLYPAMLLHFCHNGLVVVAEQWEVIGPW